MLIGLALAALSEALRKGWERAIEAERAKDLLYRELRHRTKNDFAMAVSVLNLQARTQIKLEIRQALADAASRLHVLSKAHEQLEPTDERSPVRMCDYLQALCRSLTESMGSEKADVSVDCDEAEFPVERRSLSASSSTSLSPTRSSTLSCQNEKGAVSVALRRGKNYLLSVTDNGKGCSKSATSGLGSQLVELLVRQLEGNLERTEAMPGCRVQIEFPERA